MVKEGDVVKVVPDDTTNNTLLAVWPVGYVRELRRGAILVGIVNFNGNEEREWYPLEYIHGPMRF